MLVEPTNGPQIGQMRQPGPRLKEYRLVDLARHGDIANTVAAKVIDRLAELRQTDPLEISTHFGQGGIGMVLDAQAKRLVTLTRQGFGHDDWVTAPARQQADLRRAIAIRTSNLLHPHHAHTSFLPGFDR